jgi:hypothetical protein
MIHTRDAAKGAFDKLPEEQQEMIAMIVANYHLRVGGRQEDGSRGKIEITYYQFCDLLAYLCQTP